jgi:micrococcal nuclease
MADATSTASTLPAVTCANFRIQGDAQRYLDQYGARNLDQDGDGQACEALPKQHRTQSTSQLTPSDLPSVPMRVVSIIDGDTLQVRNAQEQRLTLRLACIDAPEWQQLRYGGESARRLQQLLSVGQQIWVRPVDRDRYDRVVAEVDLGEQSINRQMVAEGLAVVYETYLHRCQPPLQQQLSQAQKQAKKNRLGLWTQNSPILPQVFRRQHSNGTVLP